MHLFQGVTDATMTHGEGWHFIELGRYLERAGATAALLDVQYRECEWTPISRPSVSELRRVGRAAASRAAPSRPTAGTTPPIVRPMRIAEFLVLNADFPRSIHFAAGRIQASLQALGALTGRGNGRAERLAGRLLASLDYGQMDEIIGDLPAYLEGIVRQANQINGAVHQQYVAYPVDQALSADAGPTCPPTTPFATSPASTTTSPVSESVMELRMQPRTDGPQRCLQFELEVAAAGARVRATATYLGNSVHHFDMPAPPCAADDHRARPRAARPAAAAPGSAATHDAWRRVDELGRAAAITGTSGSRAASPIWTPALLDYARRARRPRPREPPIR